MMQVAAIIVAMILMGILSIIVNGGEPRHLTVPPGLIELRLSAAPEGSDISWEAVSPLAADFRVYEGGHVLVTYAADGRLVFSSDVIDWDGKRRDKTSWIVTVDGLAPPPGPKPPDPPKPDETAPIKVPGLRVLVVYETQKISSMTRDQRSILYDADLRAWMTANCVKVNGVPEWRMTDQNSPVALNSPIWLEALQRPRATVPWLLISNGVSGYEGPLPATKADMMSLLEKYRMP